jgi:Cu/Ag efflux protein CusF
VIPLINARFRRKSLHQSAPVLRSPRSRHTVQSRRSSIRSFSHIFLAIVASIVIAGCGQKQASAQPERHYKLVGEVTQVDRQLHTATINGEAIAGWMEAMTMEYPIRTKQDFEKLRVGDRITATVNVRGSDYDLSDIQKQSRSK